MKNIILIGGGGHCKSVIDVILHECKWSIIGILDNQEEGYALGYPLLGNDDFIPTLINDDNAFLVTVGQIRSSAPRATIFERLVSLGATIPTVFSPHSCVSNSSIVGLGTIVMHNAMINSGARIGKNSIINTKALIEHDSIVGNHTHISTGAIVNGGSEVGDCCFVGSGAIIAQGINIGSRSVIGAGSLVLSDVDEGATVFGQHRD
jgi:sugar O-acyltransferase (sialic acid O-acetyltransferase NeuD family)